MRLLGSRVLSLRQKFIDKFQLPARFKGTVVEKWVNYWNGLVRDYTEVAVGVVKESYDKPKKAMAYAAGLYALYEASQHNPNEDIFMSVLRRHTNRMVTMASEQQNPVSAEYLLTLERAINQKKLRLLSLGICSLVWVDLYSDDDCTYPAICEYTNVSIWNFHERIVDIGFWNEFWRLKWKMRNYDINYL